MVIGRHQLNAEKNDASLNYLAPDGEIFIELGSHPGSIGREGNVLYC